MTSPTHSQHSQRLNEHCVAQSTTIADIVVSVVNNYADTRFYSLLSSQKPKQFIRNHHCLFSVHVGPMLQYADNYSVNNPLSRIEKSSFYVENRRKSVMSVLYSENTV